MSGGGSSPTSRLPPPRSRGVARAARQHDRREDRAPAQGLRRGRRHPDRHRHLDERGRHFGLPFDNALVERTATGERDLPRDKFYIPGSILRVAVQNTHPLAWGMGTEVDVFFDNSPAFTLAPRTPLPGRRRSRGFQARRRCAADGPGASTIWMARSQPPKRRSDEDASCCSDPRSRSARSRTARSSSCSTGSTTGRWPRRGRRIRRRASSTMDAWRSAVAFQPIGVVRSPFADTAGIPKGRGAEHTAEGVLELDPALEAGLTDIEGFSHLYRHLGVPQGRPAGTVRSRPRSIDSPHGVFATRSPRRPNPIGLTVVELRPARRARACTCAASTCSTARPSSTSSRTCRACPPSGCVGAGWRRRRCAEPAPSRHPTRPRRHRRRASTRTRDIARSCDTSDRLCLRSTMSPCPK